MTEVQGAPAQIAAIPSVVEQSTSVSPKTVTVDDLPPEALRQRIEQAKRTAQTELLASLGIASVDDAKTAIAAHKAATEAAKTDAEKLATLNLRVTAQAEALNVAVSQAAAKMTPDQKAAVDLIAGNDQVTWLKTVAALSPTWATPVPATSAVPAAAQPLPTSTAPATPAPTSGAPPAAPNHAAVYKGLIAANPFAAARYADKYGDACFK
jgi:hypothetical protein